MNEEKVEVYTFQFVNKTNNQKIKFEGEFLDDIFKVFSRRFNNYIDTFPPNKIKNQTVKIEKDTDLNSQWKFSSQTKRIKGILVLGKDSDKVLNFTRVDKDKTSEGKKERGINIDKPYYFEIIFSENKTRGFLILQKTDNTSCKRVMVKLIQSQINEIYEKINFKVERFIEKQIFENYLKEGRYNEITFIRNYIPNDLLQDYLGDYQEDGKFSLSTKIKAEEDTDFATKIKNKIFESFEEKRTFFAIPELEEVGFNQNDSYIKVSSTYNGKTRTIDLSDTMKVKPLYPIGDVKRNEDGFAEFESLGEKVSELLLELDIDIL